MRLHECRLVMKLASLSRQGVGQAGASLTRSAPWTCHQLSAIIQNSELKGQNSWVIPSYLNDLVPFGRAGDHTMNSIWCGQDFSDID